MLLKSRLKKEPVNLLISKNKIILSFIILYVALGLTISTPGDIVSPGDSMGNCYYVENYPYNSDSIHLKNLEFSFLNNISFSKDNFIPQGLCVTEEHVLITVYVDLPDYLGALMIFNKESGEYLLSLALDSNSHLGGIAYDGESIWICNSNDNTIERLDYDVLRFMTSFHSGATIDIRNMLEVYSVKCIPSGITFYDGTLWIVTHKVWRDSHMLEYKYNSLEDKLVLCERYPIPSQVQGVTFDEKGQVYFSVSYGRRNSSYIKVYESLETLMDNSNNCNKIIEMPPCSEQLWYEEGKLYVLFESASEKYRKGTDGLGKSLCPLDRILVIDLTTS